MDGSITLRSEVYQEAYHSKSGALEESFKKYIEPSCLRPGMRILDICFGLGYNCLAAIYTTKDLEVVSLEKDRKILDQVQEIKVQEPYSRDYEIIRQAARDLKYEDSTLKVSIVLGDATETICSLQPSFNAVFLDPFSPPKNPELWTIGFMQDISRLCRKGAILTTYSYARKVRENLKYVGFDVRDGPIVGRRSPSTIAEWNQ